MANGSDGSIVIDVNMNTGPADKKLAKLKGNIEKTEEEISDLSKKLDTAREKGLYDRAELDKEKAKLQAIKEEIAEIKAVSKDKTRSPSVRAEAAADLPARQAAYEEQKSRVSMLQTAWNRTESAVERYNQKLTDAQQRLGRQKEEAGGLEQKIALAASRAKELSDSARISDQGIVDLLRELEQLTARQAELRAAGLGLGVEEFDRITVRMEEINRQLRLYEQNLSQASDEAETAAESTEKMSAAARRANGHMSNFGSRLRSIVTGALVFNVISAGMRKFTDWVGKAILVNEDARASIAGLKGALLTLAQPIIEVVVPAFVLLMNVLTRVINLVASLVSSIFGKTIDQSRKGAKALYQESKALGGVGAAAESAAGSLAGFDEINTIATESAGEGGGGLGGGGVEPDFTGFISGKLSAIAELFTGLALLALGAILTFTGSNIPIGLALMVAGALTVYDALTSNPELVEQMVQMGLDTVFMIIGAMVAVIGVLLALTGHIALGIGLIVSGISLFKVAEGMGDEGDLGANIQKRLLEALQIIGPLVAIIGIALMVTGRLLLGLGLVVAGIALLEGAKEAEDDNGKSVQDKILSVLKRVAEAVGILIAVIGLVFLVTGKWLLGLGMLIAGVTLWEAAKEAEDDNGKSVQDKIFNVLRRTADKIAPVLATVGLILLVTGKWLKGLVLLIAGIALLLGSKQAEDDNGKSMQSKILTVLRQTAETIAPVIAILGIILIITGKWLKRLALLFAGIALFHADQVIDDNGQLMQTNIANVVNKIANWLMGLSAALVAIGVLLVFTGIAAPIGMAMLKAGIVGFFSGLALKWDFFGDKIKEVWGGIKGWWDENAAKFFTTDYWKGLGKGCGVLVQEPIQRCGGFCFQRQAGGERADFYLLPAQQREAGEFPGGGASFGGAAKRTRAGAGRGDPAKSGIHGGSRRPEQRA